MYEFLIERPTATFLIAIGLLAFGLAAFIALPIASLPEVEYPSIQVEAFLPGASAETMASSVTAPLEQQLSAGFDLKSMLSSSTAGHSVISLTFPPKHNLLQAGTEVQAANTAAQPDLPPAMTSLPIWYYDNPSQHAVLVLAFTSEVLATTVVDEYADAAIRRFASSIPGLRTVISYIRQRRVLRVEINPLALAARGVTLADVRHALRTSSDDQPKGVLEAGGVAAALSANDQLLTPDEVADTVVVWREGAPVKLCELARIAFGPEDEDDAFGTFNGRPAVAFGLRCSANANVLNVPLQESLNLIQGCQLVFRIPDIPVSPVFLPIKHIL